MNYAFIKKEAGVEVGRKCATDDSTPFTLQSGDVKTPAEVAEGDVLCVGPHGFLRVDQIIVS